MSSDNEDVRSLVRVLAGQVARCKEPLDAQAVGNCTACRASLVLLTATA